MCCRLEQDIDCNLCYGNTIYVDYHRCRNEILIGGEGGGTRMERNG